MLYKVTPMMPPPEAQKARKVKEPGQPRKRRKTAIYDADGNEVLITLMCLKCKSMKPLAQFGLRKMSDGAIRNQPWCRTCRGSAGTKKRPEAEAASEVAPVVAEIAPLDAGSAEPAVESSEAPVFSELVAAPSEGVFEETTQPAATAEPSPAIS